MKITDDNNFGRVFELPEEYPTGFCFSGGKKVEMIMVDWFNPWPTVNLRVYKSMNWRKVSNMLRPWLLSKSYINKGRRYILITDFGEAMVFDDS